MTEGNERMEFPSTQSMPARVRAAASEQDGAIILVAAFAGLRRGECLALCWRDVDFERQATRRRGSRTWPERPELQPTLQPDALQEVLPAFRVTTAAKAGFSFTTSLRGQEAERDGAPDELPCRRSRVRVPSSAPLKALHTQGFC